MSEDYEPIEESEESIENLDTGNEIHEEDPDVASTPAEINELVETFLGDEEELQPLSSEENISISTVALISEILIGQRHRTAGDTKQLEHSIKEFGLLNPITLRMNEAYEREPVPAAGIPPYILVAGLNRLTAFKNLGLPEIPATVRSMDDTTAEMMEIDENLARKDLSTLERAVHLKRRKELYNIKHNIVHGKSAVDADGNVIPRFDKQSEDVTGMAASTIREAVNLAGKLDPEVVDILKGTKIADNQAELTRLAGVDKVFQAPIAEIIAGSPEMTVAQAQAQLKLTEPLVPEPILETQDEKFEKNLLAAEGKLRFSERILREDIDIGETWSSATQLDFRDHIQNMQDVLGKIEAAFDILLDGE